MPVTGVGPSILLSRYHTIGPPARVFVPCRRHLVQPVTLRHRTTRPILPALRRVKTTRSDPATCDLEFRLWYGRLLIGYSSPPHPHFPHAITVGRQRNWGASRTGKYAKNRRFNNCWGIMIMPAPLPPCMGAHRHCPLARPPPPPINTFYGIAISQGLPPIPRLLNGRYKGLQLVPPVPCSKRLPPPPPDVANPASPCISAFPLTQAMVLPVMLYPRFAPAL